MRNAKELIEIVKDQREEYYENKFKKKVIAAIEKKTRLIGQKILATKEVDRLTAKISDTAEEIEKLGNTSEAEIKRQVDEEENTIGIAFKAWDWGNLSNLGTIGGIL